MPARKKKQPLSRERIAAAAFAIADAKGFDDVSMRNIAQKLGTGTMTLYHYVKTKDELVALMDDHMLGEVLVDGPLPQDWREALALIARRTRAVFLKHPWALLAMRGALPGPNAMKHFEQSLAALKHTKLDRNEKLDLLATVDDFVHGHVLRASEAASQSKHDKAAVAAFIEFGRAEMKTGAYPETLALFPDVDAEPDASVLTGRVDARFESGLADILDGAAQRMKKKHPRR